MPLVLQPIDQIAEAQLAQRLSCWARTADGLTDRRVQYQSCCVSPSGETLGRWIIPDELCAIYGPLTFTANEGEPIPCPPTGSAEYVLYYIYDDDVHAIDPETCVETTLAAPTGLASPTQGPTSVDLSWNAVDGAETYVVRWSLAGQDDWTELAPTAATTAQVTGLTDETDYDFQVQALAIGSVDSPWSATLTVSTTSLGTLATPTGLTSPSETGTTMDVSWNAVTNATSYTVEWSPAGAGTWTSDTTSATTYTITGLDIGTSYDVRVKATAPDWTDSAYTAPLTQSTDPQLPTPSGLASPSQTGTTVDLSWTATPGAATYVVRWSPAGAGTWTELAPAAPTTATVSGLTAGTSYDFEVKAQAPDMVDSAWSATLTQSTAAPLAAPVVTSPSQTATTVDLSWADVPNAEAYTVQWSPAGAGTWTALPDTLVPNATVTGLSPSTSYDFRVQAHAAFWDDSPWSAVLTQSTTAPPQLATPASFANGTPTTTTMPLSWDAVADADTYTVEWSPAGAGTWTPITGIAVTNTTATGLTANTSYDFRVKAVAAGFTDSDWSTVLTVSTAMEQLAAPTGLDGTGQATSTTQGLTWNAVTDATNYVARWSPAGAGTWTELAPTASTSDAVDGLSPSTSYDYQVKATAAGFTDSDWSATWTGSTTATPQLSAPADVSSPAQTPTTVDLTWTAITDADTYVVRHSPAGANTWTELAPDSVTGATVSGLTASTSYDFQVKAQGDGWIDSDWSATLTQATPAAQLAAPTGLNTTGGEQATTITMAWDDVPNAVTYVMRWSETGQNDWTELAPIADHGNTATGLSPETTYDLQAKAQAPEFTDSDWSATHNATTTAAPQLATPTGLASPSQTSTSVTLTWNAVDNAQSYRLQYAVSGTNDWIETDVAGTTTTVVSGLDASTGYDFQVRAMSPGWASSLYSATLTQSTTA